MTAKTRENLKKNPSADNATFADSQVLSAQQILDMADSMEIAAGGADVSDARLKAWALGDLPASSITRNANGVVTDATVTWPDGSAGTLETTHGYPVNSTTPNTTEAGWVAPQIVTITHADSSQTVTITMTRDINATATAVTVAVS